MKLNNLLNKTITQINSSDVDQIKAILNGGSHRLNYTNETLHQLNEVIDYFSIDLNAVSEVIDHKDMTVSYFILFYYIYFYAGLSLCCQYIG